jgi:hypothetical protein
MAQPVYPQLRKYPYVPALTLRAKTGSGMLPIMAIQASAGPELPRVEKVRLQFLSLRQKPSETQQNPSRPVK